MNSQKYTLLLALLMTIATAQAGTIFSDATVEEIRVQASKEGTPYFINFSANWCMPCRWMEEYTFQDARLQEYINRNYFALKLNIDDFDGAQLKLQYGVRFLPAVLIFNAQGVLIDRYEESLSASRLLNILEQHNIPVNRQQHDLALQQQDLLSPPISRVIRHQRLVPEKEAKTMSLTVSNTTSTPMVTYSTFNVPSGHSYSIQLASFIEHDNAVRHASKLEERINQRVEVVSHEQDDGLVIFRLLVGKYISKTEAQTNLEGLKRQNVSGFIKKII